jgi:hypothetical protein
LATSFSERHQRFDQRHHLARGDRQPKFARFTRLRAITIAVRPIPVEIYVLSTQPSPSRSASVSGPGSSPASSDTSAVAASTIGAAVIIRASRAASSASVMSLSRFVIASAERCSQRLRRATVTAIQKRCRGGEACRIRVVVLRKFNQCVDRQARIFAGLDHQIANGPTVCAVRVIRIRSEFRRRVFRPTGKVSAVALYEPSPACSVTAHF